MRRVNKDFDNPYSPGKLIEFTLTKATAMSPTLNQTRALLEQLFRSQTPS